MTSTRKPIYAFEMTGPSTAELAHNLLKLVKKGEHDEVVKQVAAFPMLMFQSILDDEGQKISPLLFILMTGNYYLKVKIFEIASANELFDLYDSIVAKYQSAGCKIKLFDQSKLANQTEHGNSQHHSPRK